MRVSDGESVYTCKPQRLPQKGVPCPLPGGRKKPFLLGINFASQQVEARLLQISLHREVILGELEGSGPPFQKLGRFLQSGAPGAQSHETGHSTDCSFNLNPMQRRGTD